MISFEVPGLPVAQPRQRHRIAKTKDRKDWVQNFTPAKDGVNTFKAAIQIACRSAYQGPPLEGPLGLQIVFIFPRPSRLRWKKRAMPRQWRAEKPDLDNLCKSVKDALKGISWLDDAQVAYLVAIKIYASGEEPIGTTVEISQLSETPPLIITSNGGILTTSAGEPASGFCGLPDCP